MPCFLAGCIYYYILYSFVLKWSIYYLCLPAHDNKKLRALISFKSNWPNPIIFLFAFQVRALIYPSFVWLHQQKQMPVSCALNDALRRVFPVPPCGYKRCHIMVTHSRVGGSPLSLVWTAFVLISWDVWKMLCGQAENVLISSEKNILLRIRDLCCLCLCKRACKISWLHRWTRVWS